MARADEAASRRLAVMIAALAACALAAAVAAVLLLPAGPASSQGRAAEPAQAPAAAQGKVELAATSAEVSFEDAGGGAVRAEVKARLRNDGGADALAVTSVELGLSDLALRDAVASAAVELGRRLAPGEEAELSASFELDADAYAQAGSVTVAGAGRAVEVEPLSLGDAVTTVTAAKEELAAARERARAAAEAAERERARAREAASSSSSSSSAPGGSASSQPQPSQQPAAPGEWAPRLDAYLAGSPMAGLGAALARAAEANGTDPRLSAAIAAVETGKGARCRRAFDAWNWGGGAWDGWEAAVAAHEAAMASAYGKDPLSGMAAATRAQDASWEASVRAQMELI